MTALLTAITGFIIAFAGRVGFKVAFYATLFASVLALYLAGYAVLYLAFKALILAGSSWFTIPTVAQYALYFMPSTAAVSSASSMVIGSHIIAANFRAWFFAMNNAQQYARQI